MQGICHLLLIAYLAFVAQSRLEFFKPYAGLPRYLLALGLVLFGTTWADFLLYALLGWGLPYTIGTWAVRLLPLVFWLARPGTGVTPTAGFLPTCGQLATTWKPLKWDYAFIFFGLFVLSRFFIGINTDTEGTVWTNFNFVDTAFHLSIAQAFLNTSSFPPADPNLAGFPLKYHFVADFSISHLAQMGIPLITAVWWLNLLGAAAMVGAMWGALSRWLRLPSAWVMLAGFTFLFTNLAIVNLLHYCLFNPAFFNSRDPIDGIFFFPYFNFESIHNNLLEPQRSLLFVMPVIFAVLSITQADPPQTDEATRTDRRNTLIGFWMVCLLPLAHVVAFAVLGACLLPRLWRHHRWLLPQVACWLPALLIGLAQLAYIQFYGPPIQSGYSAWDASQHIPLHNFSELPEFARSTAFWLAVNGDFFFWGAVFTLIAISRYLMRSTPTEGLLRVSSFGRQWAWYFAVCVGAFLLINHYRYTASWGDSNKFVFFLNLGITLLIVLGSAQWLGGPNALRSRVAWWFFFLTAFVPNTYDFVKKQITLEGRTNLLFHHQTRFAADWIQSHLPPEAIFLTAASADAHFLPALAARSVRAGIYVRTNPYFDPELASKIRRLYEEGDLSLLAELAVDYVCISNTERNLYTLDPRWQEWMQNPSIRIFASGAPNDYNSVYILDAHRLLALANANP
jgi:hypothetical protein